MHHPCEKSCARCSGPLQCRTEPADAIKIHLLHRSRCPLPAPTAPPCGRDPTESLSLCDQALVLPASRVGGWGQAEISLERGHTWGKARRGIRGKCGWAGGLWASAGGQGAAGHSPPRGVGGGARGLRGRRGRRVRARGRFPTSPTEQTAVSAVMSQLGSRPPAPSGPSPPPRGGRDARPSPRATNQLAAGARAPRAANQRGGRGAGRAGPGARSPSRGAAVTAPSAAQERQQLRARGPAPMPGRRQ